MSCHKKFNFFHIEIHLAATGVNISDVFRDCAYPKKQSRDLTPAKVELIAGAVVTSDNYLSTQTDSFDRHGREKSISVDEKRPKE